MEAVYREHILDHYQNPTNRGSIDEPTIREHDSNPLCGDDLTIDILVGEGGSITDCRFHGHGCSISQAAADILCSDIVGKTARDILDMSKEDMLELLGIDLGPVRLKCGLLAYKAVKVGMVKYLENEDKRGNGNSESQSL
jgi:nitrogen fixation NifU-like protein